jgi:O-acetyl-ADP-ribose deacetylase (regulator of RNase III)
VHVTVKQGDLLEEEVEVLVSTANVQLNMSGGVNGAILARGGASIQAELRDHLARIGSHFVDPGAVVRTGPGPLGVKHVLHAVAIDGLYTSDVALVRRTCEAVLDHLRTLGAASAALPALATGYGPLNAEEFAAGLGQALAGAKPSGLDLRVVLWRARDVAPVSAKLCALLGEDAVSTVAPGGG